MEAAFDGSMGLHGKIWQGVPAVARLWPKSRSAPVSERAGAEEIDDCTRNAAKVCVAAPIEHSDARSRVLVVDDDDAAA